MLLIFQAMDAAGNARLSVSQIVLDVFEKLKMSWPEVSEDRRK